MNKICTDLEQSHKLVELGLDPNTADMFWDTLLSKKPECHVNNHSYADDYNEEYTFPAWSLSALLGLMPYYELIRTDSSYELSIGRLNALISEGNETHIDLAVDMVIWLLENGYISRKNQGLGSKAEK